MGNVIISNIHPIKVYANLNLNFCIKLHEVMILVKW